MRKKSGMGKFVWEGAGMMRRKMAQQRTGRTGNAGVSRASSTGQGKDWGLGHKGMRATDGFVSSLPQCLPFLIFEFNLILELNIFNFIFEFN